MIDQIKSYLNEVQSFHSTSPQEIENFRIRFLGKKGLLNSLFVEFKNVPNTEKKEIGQQINTLKNAINEKIQELKSQSTESQQNSNKTDLTLPAENEPVGSRHPVSIVRNQICEIFNKIGFTIAEGPEIENDWHLFSGLNFPPEHPARDMQDTFFIEKNPDIMLRTHTSSVQIRVMQSGKPPLRQIFPGRVFRNEAISARSHCIFHQVEGLYIDENVSFADLKQTLVFFAREMFGMDSKIRLRPSYFPFTEPSAEMDVSCTICNGTGCNICKYTGWLEILGCGMVDPNVLDNTGISSEQYTGFAFGMGIERIALLKYQIKDIRILFENDIRFLHQFSGTI
ncbi:MAG: phenylalanine--tRNA ligase subunit alpha [Bacteroidetes bacterium]|jgi:phenylalanyl-tRNA synthetase alpha chain|nr:phenylalanine--tRNA ligase subunit alpha [Bacteroidota bacterium]